MTDISAFEVNKDRCHACPFGENGLDIVRWRVEKRCLSASQICHSTDSTLCRGARDYQLQIFYRMGFLAAPTDEEWAKKRKELGC